MRLPQPETERPKHVNRFPEVHLAVVEHRREVLRIGDVVDVQRILDAWSKTPPGRPNATFSRTMWNMAVFSWTRSPSMWKRWPNSNCLPSSGSSVVPSGSARVSAASPIGRDWEDERLVDLVSARSNQLVRRLRQLEEFRQEIGLTRSFAPDTR